jgi:hypothetical protein
MAPRVRPNEGDEKGQAEDDADPTLTLSVRTFGRVRQILQPSISTDHEPSVLGTNV